MIQQEIINQADESQISDDKTTTTVKPQTGTEIKDETKPEETKIEIIPTEDDLKAFTIIKSVLEKAGRDTKDLNFKKTTAYISINNVNILRWFSRINLDSASKNIIVRLDQKTIEPLAAGLRVEPAPHGLGETRVYVTSVDDFKKLDKMIVTCFDAVIRKKHLRRYRAKTYFIIFFIIIKIM